VVVGAEKNINVVMETKEDKVDQISTQVWSKLRDECPNCGTEQKPLDDPDVGPDSVEVTYLCENCGMGLEVIYALEEVQVTKQPHPKQTTLAALCDILVLHFTAYKRPGTLLPGTLLPGSKQGWLDFFAGVKIHSLEDLVKEIDRRVSSGSIV